MAAASRLLETFARGDLDGYFSAFVPSATFIFHSVPTPLASVEEYRSAWRDWVATFDLRIIGCTSERQSIDFVTSEVALFTHAVRVTASTREGIHQRRERETIVFARQADGRWLGVHEHLSADPNP